MNAILICCWRWEDNIKISDEQPFFARGQIFKLKNCVWFASQAITVKIMFLLPEKFHIKLLSDKIISINAMKNINITFRTFIFILKGARTPVRGLQLSKLLSLSRFLDLLFTNFIFEKTVHKHTCFQKVCHSPCIVTNFSR